MPYLSYEQVATTNSVRDVNNLTVPAQATGAELQAADQHARYTMDDSTDPAAGSGMLLLTTSPPKFFLIENVRRIRFISSAGAGELNIHYSAGREIS